PVMQHAAKWCVEKGLQPNFLCCIYATAPFVRAEDIQNGLRVISQSECDYAFTVTSFPFPIQRALRLNSDGKIEMFESRYYDARSQDLEEAFHDAGQFYWGSADAWLEAKPVFLSDSMPIYLPRSRVQD